MRLIKLGIWLIVLCLAACSSPGITPSSGAVGGEEDSASPSPSVLPDTPLLLSPADGTVFADASNVVLSWQWNHPLMDNEYFDVRVWRGSDPHDGITWTKDNSLKLTDWLLKQQPGEFFWSIAVLIGDDMGQVDSVLTNEAPVRRFTVNNDVLPVDAVVKVPPGFQVTKFAELSDAATAETAITVLTLGPDGQTFYVLTLDGRIFTLKDTDGDHIADTITPVFLNQNHLLDYAVGLAFHDGVMYISDGGRVSRFLDNDHDGTPETLVPIVKGLPSRIYVWHSNNGITFGPDNKLYVAIGATSDHGPLKEPQESMILRMNPDGSDQEIFATGFRNPYDLTFSPKGELFTADNGPDTGPDDVPPDRWVEELDYVLQGRDYGFPRVFGFPPPGDKSEPPVAEFLPHTVSSGLTYYAATQFPEHYRNGIFVSQWGGGTIPNGHMVVFVPLQPTGDGRYKGTWEPFATFDTSARPVDVMVGPDGALYIAEWTRGWILRVAYIGS